MKTDTSVNFKGNFDRSVYYCEIIHFPELTKHEAGGAALGVAAQLASNRCRAFLPSVLPCVSSCTDVTNITS